MGMFDEIRVPCPQCGESYYAQSKGGDCTLAVYELDNIPLDVLGDVNRHAPFTCKKCGAMFAVKVDTSATAVIAESEGCDG